VLAVFIAILWQSITRCKIVIIILVKNECELVVEEVKATTLKLGPRTCTENSFCSICLMYYLYIVSVDMRLPYTKCKMFSTSLTYMYIA